MEDSGDGGTNVGSRRKGEKRWETWRNRHTGNEGRLR